MQEELLLITACREGDRKAQHRLYQLYARQMYAICMRYVSDPDDAQDILQEGFVAIYRHLDSFRGENRLFFWMRTVMVNTALNFLRRTKKKRELTDTLDEGLQVADTDTAEMGDLSVEDCMKAVSTLSEGYRTVFNLYAVEGYSHAEIGALLGISEGTSKSQYSRAIKHLRTRLGLPERGAPRTEEPRINGHHIHLNGHTTHTNGTLKPVPQDPHSPLRSELTAKPAKPME
jgi:RNA polymerase sigma-70 factor (ECF subfamily)